MISQTLTLSPSCVFENNFHSVSITDSSLTIPLGSETKILPSVMSSCKSCSPPLPHKAPRAHPIAPPATPAPADQPPSRIIPSPLPIPPHQHLFRPISSAASSPHFLRRGALSFLSLSLFSIPFPFPFPSDAGRHGLAATLSLSTRTSSPPITTAQSLSRNSHVSSQ